MIRFLNAFLIRKVLIGIIAYSLPSPALAQTEKKITQFPKNLVAATSESLITDFSVQGLTTVKNLGIKELEITWLKFIKATPEERLARAKMVAENAKKAGLVLWSTHLPYGHAFDISEPDEAKRAAVINNLKEYIDLALVMQVKQMVLHPSREPIADSIRQAHIDACRKSLKELSAYIKGKPVQLNIEDLPRTCLANTSTEILKILNGMPEIGICFDANHLLHEKTQDFIRAVSHKIRTIHISDYDGIDEKHWLPGRGINDWNKIIDALIETGYKGPFVYEVVRHKDENFTVKDLKANYDGLVKAWLSSKLSGNR